MLMETHVLEKEDMHILDRIKTFAMSVADVVPPAKQLILLVERAVRTMSTLLRKSADDGP